MGIILLTVRKAYVYTYVSVNKRLKTIYNKDLQSGNATGLFSILVQVVKGKTN